MIRTETWSPSESSVHNLAVPRREHGHGVARHPKNGQGVTFMPIGTGCRGSGSTGLERLIGGAWRPARGTRLARECWAGGPSSPQRTSVRRVEPRVPIPKVFVIMFDRRWRLGERRLGTAEARGEGAARPAARGGVAAGAVGARRLTTGESAGGRMESTAGGLAAGWLGLRLGRAGGARAGRRRAGPGSRVGGWSGRAAGRLGRRGGRRGRGRGWRAAGAERAGADGLPVGEPGVVRGRDGCRESSGVAANGLVAGEAQADRTGWGRPRAGTAGRGGSAAPARASRPGPGRCGTGRTPRRRRRRSGGRRTRPAGRQEGQGGAGPQGQAQLDRVAISGRRSVDWPVAASVASGWNSTGLASTAAKSIGNVVWYRSSISARTSTTGPPRSSAEQRIRVLA